MCPNNDVSRFHHSSSIQLLHFVWSALEKESYSHTLQAAAAATLRSETKRQIYIHGMAETQSLFEPGNSFCRLRSSA